MHPSQLAHRVRLRGQRALIIRAPRLAQKVLLREPSTALRGWPEGFLPLDARATEEWPSARQLADGRITLLGQERLLGDWLSAAPPQLWRFHLHYWDWAWSLVADPDRSRGRAVYAKLIREWREQSRFGHWDEWSPYVASLRAWAWCGQFDALAKDGPVERELVDLLALHAGFLVAHLELDVGGNHLVKNLKALIGLAVFLGDDELQRRSLRRMAREVDRQVLRDGGHFERAPAYHCQVLGDLIDLADLLGDASPSWLSDAIPRMRRWLGLVLLPDGAVPLLNDGFPVSKDLVQLLEPGPAAPDGLTLLPDTGLAVLRKGRSFVLADVGLPCPPELPAHAHADTLGFLMYDGHRAVVTESGTSTYVAGTVRQHERGTAAHSTVQVDGADSTEVWGAFRAARRAIPTVLRADDDGMSITLSASHDGFTRLAGAPVHTRTWCVSDGEVRVVDEVAGQGQHEMVLRLHGTPMSAVSSSTGVLSECLVVHAQGWERRAPSSALQHAARATLPWRFETILRSEEMA
jgi:uncharacterized heparinase superfamily protein